jgi:hypothetical protein
MKNKKLIGITALVFAASITVAFDVMDNSGQAGRTGSPGESTCTGCHNTFALNDGTGSVTITSPELVLNGWNYMPGDTYNISVTVNRVGNSLFGIGVECLTGSTPAQNGGTLIITNTAETTIKNASVSSVIRKNVVHKLNGGVGTDSKTFSFKWAAPASNVGNVTFYVAGNAANGTNTTSGDHIYTISQVVTPDPTAGVFEVQNETFSIYPNPAQDHISVSFFAEAGETISFELFSVDGKSSAILYTGEGDGSKHEMTMQLPTDLAGGVYVLKFTEGANVSVSKVIVQ